MHKLTHLSPPLLHMIHNKPSNSHILQYSLQATKRNAVVWNIQYLHNLQGETVFHSTPQMVHFSAKIFWTTSQSFRSLFWPPATNKIVHQLSTKKKHYFTTQKLQ